MILALVLSLPFLFCALSGTSAVVLGVAAYCSWRICKVRRYGQPGQNLGSVNDKQKATMTISQSTPDFDTLKAVLEEVQVPVGRQHYKTVVKQTTLPSMPQRHESFRLQASQQLDMSQVPFCIQSVKYREQPAVKPELYSEQVPKFQTKSGIASGGWLTFTLKYSHLDQQLQVRVLRAADLPTRKHVRTSDPYVKIYLLPDRRNKHQTKVQRKSSSPEFNECFHFQVLYNELQNRVLQFSVYDFDRFSRHDLLGVIVVRDLMQQNNLSFEQEFTYQIQAVTQEKQDLGELMLSLCYLPTAGRLTVTVIKARALKAMDITGTSDPYVKVSLMFRGRRIKKKKTAVKSSTLNPIYNEAIVFDVPQENIDEISLDVTVLDHDRVGSNEVIGCCSLGFNQIGLGRDHWSTMLDQVRRPVAQWYNLTETHPITNESKRKKRRKTFMDKCVSDESMD